MLLQLLVGPNRASHNKTSYDRGSAKKDDAQNLQVLGLKLNQSDTVVFTYLTSVVEVTKGLLEASVLGRGVVAVF